MTKKENKEKKITEEKIATFLFSQKSQSDLSKYFTFLKSQQNQHNISLTEADKFFAHLETIYLCAVNFESLILQYCLVISYLLKSHNLELAHQIFLLMMKENKKSMIFFFYKLKQNLKKIDNPKSKISSFFPQIMLIYLRVLCCLIKFSDKFSTRNIRDNLTREYLYIIILFSRVKFKQNDTFLKNFEKKRNMNFILSKLYFNFSYYHVLRFSPIKIPIIILEKIKNEYQNITEYNLNPKERYLLTKVHYNLGILYYANGLNKEALHNISVGKEFLYSGINPIIINEINLDKRKDFYRKASIIDTKQNRRSSAPSFKSKSIVKNEVKILMQIELSLAEIYLDNKQYMLAYENIDSALKLYPILNDDPQINKNKCLSRYINYFLKVIKKQYDEDNLVEKIKRRSSYFNQNNIRKKAIDDSTKQMIKEMEKFFLFLNSLSLYQIKKLNDLQPKASEFRNSVPILFSTQFKNCLSHSQRVSLAKLSGTFSRYILLKDPNQNICPNNLNIQLLNLREKTIVSGKSSRKESLKSNGPNEDTLQYKYLEQIKISKNINSKVKRFLDKNDKLAYKILKRVNEEELNLLIENPEMIVDAIKKFIKEKKDCYLFNIKEESEIDDDDDNIDYNKEDDSLEGDFNEDLSNIEEQIDIEEYKEGCSFDIKEPNEEESEEIQEDI